MVGGLARDLLDLDCFLDLMERGKIHRKLRPIHWCVRDETALAEAEVEYEDKTSPAIDVGFKVVEGDKLAAAFGLALAAASPAVAADNEKCYGVAKAGENDCGSATGTHIHLVRKYNGEWMPAEGIGNAILAFNLEGWVSSGAGTTCNVSFTTICSNAFTTRHSALMRMCLSILTGIVPPMLTGIPKKK